MKKILFIISQCTWGLLMNSIGALVFLVLIITGHTHKKYKSMIYFELGNPSWGGFNLGFVAIVNKNPSEFILKHEYGHFVQNAIYGILQPILVDIPSVIRYWYRKLLNKNNKPGYYDIWFEKQANKLGGVKNA